MFWLPAQAWKYTVWPRAFFSMADHADAGWDHAGTVSEAASKVSARRRLRRGVVVSGRVGGKGWVMVQTVGVALNHGSAQAPISYRGRMVFDECKWGGVLMSKRRP